MTEYRVVTTPNDRYAIEFKLSRWDPFVWSPLGFTLATKEVAIALAEKMIKRDKFKKKQVWP